MRTRRIPRRVAPSGVKDDAPRKHLARRGSPIQHFEHLSRKLKTFHQSTMFKLIVALCASSAVAFQSAMPAARAT